MTDEDRKPRTSRESLFALNTRIMRILKPDEIEDETDEENEVKNPVTGTEQPDQREE